jgi:hypothetical protein
MLERLVNFIAKCKLSEFAIGVCHSKKMYNVTIFLSIKITFARTFAKFSQPWAFTNLPYGKSIITVRVQFLC